MGSATKFWMVYGLKRNPPRYQHYSRASAEREARRLARLAPGEGFVVLEVVGGYWVPDPVVEPIAIVDGPGTIDDGIPF